MTEGAERGVNVKPANEWIGNILLVKYSDLTEALKVAGEAQYFVQQLLADLPAKRDWLNPDIERALKDFTNSAALERLRKP